jgi:tetratricopeptide (TPR) repeat protein
VRFVIAVILLGGAVQASEREAAELFARGRADYQRGEYEKAYQHFREAYLQSSRPALIYNMARALEGLKRYGEAAGSLRAYLRVVPNEPERGQIEEHIRALDEAQSVQSSGALALTPGPLRGDDRAPPPRRRTLAIALAVTSVAVVGLAVGLGVGLGTRGPSYSSTDVGPLKSTP